MFMQYSAEELLRPIGIQRERLASGRKRSAALNVAGTFPGFTIELDFVANTTTESSSPHYLRLYEACTICCCWIVIAALLLLLSDRYIKTASIYSCSIQEFKHLDFTNCLDSILQKVRESLYINVGSLCVLILSYSVKSGFEIIQFLILYLLIHVLIVECVRELSTLLNTANICISIDTKHEERGRRAGFFDFVRIVVFTVRALYAGTLVTTRTTAPRHNSSLRSYSVLLAALCIILATLTIAARCYASTNTIVQLSPQYPQQHAISPILIKHNSKPTQQVLSSNIVLSRLFANPRKYVQSDTSVIQTNSKALIQYNQNNHITRTSKRTVNSRNKRELQPSQFYNYNQDNSVKFNAKSVEHGLDSATLGNNEIPSNPTNPSNPSNQIEYKRVDNSINQNVNAQPPFNLRTKIPYIKKVPPINKVNSINELNLTLANKTDFEDSISVTSASSRNNSNASVNSTRVSSTFLVDVDQQNDRGFEPGHAAFDQTSALGTTGINRFMPAAHGHETNTLRESVLVLVVAVVLLTLALGLVTCVLSHYRGDTAANLHDPAHTPTTAPMLSVVSAGATAGVGGMDRLRGRGAARELAATRDRQVRIHAVHTDIAINLPPSIALPDGEEHPFNSRLHIRDTEQESEIYQKCIRPPPNRTALESESPPPYRSSSAGLLGSIGGSSSGISEWSGGSVPPMVVRCHSLSSTSKKPDPAGSSSGQKTDFIQRTVKIFTGKKSQPPPAPTLPPMVIVPTRTRRITEHNLTSRPKPNV